MSRDEDRVRVRAIQARNYRSLRHVDVRFDRNFYILVGPNGSGKSTLLDAISFLSDFLHGGLKAAVDQRTSNFQDLAWGRPSAGPGFDLAAEYSVGPLDFRYEVRIAEGEGGVAVVRENGYLGHVTRRAFSAQQAGQGSIVRRTKAALGRSGLKQVFARDGNETSFYSERDTTTLRVDHMADQSAMRYLPLVHDFPGRGGETRPTMDMSKSIDACIALMTDTVQSVQLDSRRLRQAATPDSDDGTSLTDDGWNLPRVLKKLYVEDREQWDAWFDHVREALPGLEGIRTQHRPEERADYLMVKRNGVEVPSWGVSEGTLRLLALTVIPYLRSRPIAYLLEEPENGIHPLAIEFAYQSLSTVYGAQVFIASHSPTLLRAAKTHDVLCFGLHPEKGTVIVRGDPRLSEWQGGVDDDVFWAADILA